MKQIIGSALIALMTTHAFAIDIPVVPMSVLAQEKSLSEKSTNKLVPSAENLQDASQTKKTAPKKVARTDRETGVVTEKYPSKEVRQIKKTDANSQAASKPAPKIANTGEAIEASRAIIEMKPGVTQLVTVARNHLNRVVTPFSSPKVMKIDKKTKVDVRDNVLYVATSSTAPVTMFIREEGSEHVALSLTLIPKKIPPRELFLKLPEASYGQFAMRSNARAKRWEEGGSYTKRLKELNRSLALGEVPNGYVMRDMRSNEHKPLCAQDGLSFSFNKAQIIEGHHLEVIIGTVKNAGNHSTEFVERSCGGYQVRSVAAWPNVVMVPGQTSEVFIVRSSVEPTNIRTRRPTLLGGQL